MDEIIHQIRKSHLQTIEALQQVLNGVEQVQQRLADTSAGLDTLSSVETEDMIPANSSALELLLAAITGVNARSPKPKQVEMETWETDEAKPDKEPLKPSHTFTKVPLPKAAAGEALVDLRRICNLIGIKPSRIKGWFAHGLPHTMMQGRGKGGRVRVYNPSDVHQWLSERYTAAGKGTPKMPPLGTTQIVSTQEVARELGVESATVLRYAADKTIPYLKIGSRYHFFQRDVDFFRTTGFDFFYNRNRRHDDGK